jgi:hypothetical protein
MLVVQSRRPTCRPNPQSFGTTSTAIGKTTYFYPSVAWNPSQTIEQASEARWILKTKITDKVKTNDPRVISRNDTRDARLGHYFTWLSRLNVLQSLIYHIGDLCPNLFNTHSRGVFAANPIGDTRLNPGHFTDTDAQKPAIRKTKTISIPRIGPYARTKTIPANRDRDPHSVKSQLNHNSPIVRKPRLSAGDSH